MFFIVLEKKVCNEALQGLRINVHLDNKIV